MTRRWKGTIPLLSGALLLGLTIITFAVPRSPQDDGFAQWLRQNSRPDANHHDARRRLRDKHHFGRHPQDAREMLHHWNAIAVDASGLDHTPSAPDETRVFGEQFGPGRSSRAMAIVHIAVFDAVNAIAGDCETYSRVPRAPESASMQLLSRRPRTTPSSRCFPHRSAT